MRPALPLRCRRQTPLNAVPEATPGFPLLSAAQPDTRFLAVSTLTNNGHSNYNGLVLSYRHQGGHGLTTAVNYAYSHSLDNVSNGGIESFTYNPVTGSSNVLTQIDPTSPDRLNYGNSDYDNKHNVSVNYVWQIPYKFQNMLMKNALQGWTLSGTFFAKSGAPYSVIRSGLSSYYTSSTDAGSTLGGFLGGARGACGTPSDVCLKASQFASKTAQYQYGFGNIARNSFRGPMYLDTDMQVSKITAIPGTERVSFKIGANIFNILNHPNFGDPGNNLALGSFGQIQADIPPVSSPYGNFQGAGVSGRIIQVLGGITF